MDPNSRLVALGAAGAAAEGLYVEDVFSTWLYTGNGSTQTITNGIDLAGEGGLVWIKKRVNTSGTDGSHALFDSLRGSAGNGSSLATNTTASEITGRGGWGGFTSSGFNVSSSVSHFNYNGDTYASWTFRKAPKFFDVVTYTGDGIFGRTVSHNLGSVPGCIIVKRTDSTAAWFVYHRSTGAFNALQLNTTDAAIGNNNYWANTSPTSSVFSLGIDARCNASGATYVAYLFAHDAGGFGDDGTESVIKCGSYTGTGTANHEIDLGWEPQWVLIKQINNDSTYGSAPGNWFLIDNMRGVSTGGSHARLSPNVSDAESTSGTSPLGGGRIEFYQDGFRLNGPAAGIYNRTATYIYIAIRRGPMKTPTDATKVFSALTSSGSTGTTLTTGFAVDMQIARTTTFVDSLMAMVLDRLRGVSSTTTANQGPTLTTSATNAENTVSYTNRNWSNTGFDVPNYIGGLASVYYSFRRAPGFFDVVAYTGTGSARTVAHNLGVAPELMIVKKRNNSQNWIVYAEPQGPSKAGYLDLSGAFFSDSGNAWNNTAPTSTEFTVNSYSSVNSINDTYIAYLFATCLGVSKVGSYTGTGTTLQIDCGFASGSRLVLIKRTDSTGSWYIWDTARGITSSSDPYLLLNSTAAEVTGTDYIDPYSAGFEISSSAPAEINASGGSYIFLAIS